MEYYFGKKNVENDMTVNAQQTECRRGRVERLEGGWAMVRMERPSACSACKAHGVCRESNQAGVLVRVAVARGEQLSVGQGVVLTVARSAAYKSVALGYGLPLALMIIACLAANMAGCTDDVTAMVSLGCVAGYYLIMFLARRLIERTFGQSMECRPADEATINIEY